MKRTHRVQSAHSATLMDILDRMRMIEHKLKQICSPNHLDTYNSNLNHVDHLDVGVQVDLPW